LIKILDSFKICEGISNNLSPLATGFIEHCVPKHYFPVDDESSFPLFQQKFLRSVSCLLLSRNSICENCSKFEKKEMQLVKKKAYNLSLPAKPNAPIKSTSTDRIKLAMQSFRIETKELKAQIKELQQEISTNSIAIDNELNDDFKSIMSKVDESKLSPFMRFFWEEQQKYLSSNPNSVRYHPMVIRYCLSLASKSPACMIKLDIQKIMIVVFLLFPAEEG